MDKDTEIATLREENRLYIKRIAGLEELVKELMSQIDRLTVKKNSNNSSIPPSTDLLRKNSSLRTASGKKPGGQKGHTGTTLKMTDTPDETHKLIPDYCNQCGTGLAEIEGQFESKRQVVEIPPIKPIYIEYQSHSKTCLCGHKQTSDYPCGVTNHIQYGASIEAIIGYQSVYQYTPFKRLSQLFQHYFNLPISEGSIGNILKRLSAKATPVYEAIHAQIENSTQVGADETGVKINGKKGWIWTWQNKAATFIVGSFNRGHETIQKLFPNGFIKAILNSDRWKPQLNTTAKGHQMCTAHLLRDLEYLIELEKTTWAETMKQLLLKAIELKRKCAEYATDHPYVLELETMMDVLLVEPLNKSKTLTFQKAMVKNRVNVFTFLYYEEVPPDNNSSERAIRNIKVKQKVSGQFKTGMQPFCILRSIIDTCIKNKVDVFEALKLIAQMKLPIKAGE